MTDLRFMLGPETVEIVDRLLGDFMVDCIGKNDMAVVNAMLASAAMLIVAHCERTGQDFDEVVALCRNSFDLALTVANDHRPRA
jgi:hypothetical protein